MGTPLGSNGLWIDLFSWGAWLVCTLLLYRVCRRYVPGRRGTAFWVRTAVWCAVVSLLFVVLIRAVVFSVVY